MAAAVHHENAGRRATAVERKVVFKSVLDNPFKVSWPHVPQNVQNSALAVLVTLLADVGEYHVTRQSASRKRKLARHDKERKEKVKKRKVGDRGGAVVVEDANVVDEDTVAMDAEAAAVPVPEVDPTPLPPPPPVLSHLTFGINEVTKRLEAQSHSLRARTIVHPPSTTPNIDAALSPSAPLTHIFVCRADIDPPLLIAHLPSLVAACNVPSPSAPPPPVLLIPLPLHAEQTLADVIGVRRVSILALDSTTPSLDTLKSLLSSVQPPSAPWLTTTTTEHVPTHIKQLRTTAPRDMRAAKRERTEGRQDAKEKKKESSKNKQDDKGEKEEMSGREKGKDGTGKGTKGEQEKGNGKQDGYGASRRDQSGNAKGGRKRDVKRNGNGKEKPHKEKGGVKKRIKITAPVPPQSTGNLKP